MGNSKNTVAGWKDSLRGVEAAVAGFKPTASAALTRRQAWFRYQLRQFLHFSEKAARAAGLTRQQHQLLLGVAGFTDRGWATISELAEFLQERHNAVVGLVQRAARRGWIRKREIARDRRLVRVELTPKGRTILARLTRLHRDELVRFEARLADFTAGRDSKIKEAN